MPNSIRYLMMSILSIGMIILAIMAFWVFLLIIGVMIIARLIYAKLFKKGNSGTFTVHTFTVRHGGSLGKNEQEYTTVIDADDMDQEYTIPKIK